VKRRKRREHLFELIKDSQRAPSVKYMGSTQVSIKKIDIYKRLLHFKDFETLDHKAFAEAMGITGQALGGMVNQLKHNPNIRKELEGLGYTGDQIPDWIAKPESMLKSVVELASATLATSDAPLPAGTPKAVGRARKTAQATKQVNQPGQPSQVSTPPSGPIEGLGGQLALPVGQMNRESWMRKEGVVKSGDKYYKLIQLADSSTAWKEVEIPPDILAQERAAAGKVSEMIFNTMEAETQSLVRKVGLNPNVYTGFNYLKARGDLAEEDDLGDFINMAVDFFLDKGFGMRVAVITDENRSLIKRVKVQEPTEQVEFIR
jgi:hypothetical protein